MIVVYGKPRLTQVSHAQWRASFTHGHDIFTTAHHSAVGHSPESAYRNLKGQMEHVGYLLVAPQQKTPSVQGLGPRFFDTLPREVSVVQRNNGLTEQNAVAQLKGAPLAYTSHGDQE